MKKLYMHTLLKEPAIWDGKAIYYGVRAVRKEEMATSLYQLRKQQKLSTKYRVENGFGSMECQYGYVIIYI